MVIFIRFSTYIWKLSFLVLRFKNFVLYCTLGRGEATNQSLQNSSTKKESMPNGNYETKFHARYAQKCLRVNWRFAKNSTAKGLRAWSVMSFSGAGAKYAQRRFEVAAPSFDRTADDRSCSSFLVVHELLLVVVVGRVPRMILIPLSSPLVD